VNIIEQILKKNQVKVYNEGRMSARETKTNMTIIVNKDRQTAFQQQSIFSAGIKTGQIVESFKQDNTSEMMFG
jgi:hypothetical protein